MTTLATDVVKQVIEIDAQVQQMIGWDSGTAMWNLHAHEEDDSDLTAMKLGGPEHLEVHPVAVIEALSPIPPCTRGLILSFEAWHSPSGFDPSHDAPDRKDVRYVVAAMRTGLCLLLEHKRDEKPRLTVMDPHKLLHTPQIVNEVCSRLHDFVVRAEHEDQHASPLAALLRAMQDGGGSGFIFMSGGPE